MFITEFYGQDVVDSKLKASGLVTRQETIELLGSVGVEVLHIDTHKGSDCEQAIPLECSERSSRKTVANVSAQKSAQKRLPAKRTGVDKELESAKRIRSRAFDLINKVFDDVKMGGSIDVDSSKELANEILDSLDNNQDALIGLMRMRKVDEYLLEHSTNVATLMGVLGRFMGFGGKDLQDMVLGAFLHDVGKVNVPQHILDKPGSLDKEEWEEVKRHVTYGIEILEKLEGLPPVAMEICSQHHERLDGGGYPYGLNDGAISTAGRIAAVVDVYDAITASRVYHKGIEPSEALRKMVSWSENHLDREIVYQLIRCLGVYPAGSFVKLSSGYIAMITEVNYKTPKLPIVVLFYNAKMKVRVPFTQVDLSGRTQSYGTIAELVEPADFGLSSVDYYLSEQ